MIDDPTVTDTCPQRVPRRSQPLARIFLRVSRRSHGQNVVEYGLMIASIALVVLFGVHAFGQELLVWFTPLAARITTTGT
jgi:Flp pilus assembly pilin Flp